MKRLEELKAGDLVIVHGTTDMNFQPRLLVRKIERVTKTMIHVGGRRFRRSSGHPVGDTWAKTHISVPEPGQIEAVRAAEKRGRLINALDCIEHEQYSQMSDSVLQRVFKILDKEMMRLAKKG